MRAVLRALLRAHRLWLALGNRAADRVNECRLVAKQRCCRRANDAHVEEKLSRRLGYLCGDRQCGVRAETQVTILERIC
eukprot:3427842-Pleurochrysis_carterae.AAC.1